VSYFFKDVEDKLCVDRFPVRKWPASLEESRSLRYDEDTQKNIGEVGD
jgi:hypothetical protein